MPSDRSDPTRRFSDRVENYIRYRPGYPRETLDILRDEIDFDPTWTVADIGSGTGISTRMFLDNGNEVFAVEPNDAMRHAAERLLSGYPAFRSVAGSAEATGLHDHSIRLAVAMQAFHWFKVTAAREELKRILRPGGHVLLVWNERRFDTPFLRAYEDLLLRRAVDYAKVRHENVDAAALSAFFGGPYVSHTLDNHQAFDFDALRGRLMSSSYAPAESEPGFPMMLDELRAIFDAHHADGRVRLLYHTRLHLGRLA
jgi:SAM-dependent methyltransferase